MDKTSPALTCSCGYDKDSPYIEIKNVYSFWGWLALIMGISAKPVKAKFQCSHCNEVIETTTNPEILNRYIN